MFALAGHRHRRSRSSGCAPIHEGTQDAKEQHNAIGADTLQDWAEFAAPAVFGRAARLYSRMKLADRHRPLFNVTISNVPGPPFPLYSAGAPLVANYPMGPIIDGGGLNITVMSYQDHLDFGLLACPRPGRRRVVDRRRPARRARGVGQGGRDRAGEGSVGQERPAAKTGPAKKRPAKKRTPAKKRPAKKAAKRISRSDIDRRRPRSARRAAAPRTQPPRRRLS